MEWWTVSESEQLEKGGGGEDQGGRVWRGSVKDRDLPRPPD